MNQTHAMEIDAETLRLWLEEGRPVTVLDIRPKDQRKEWAIPGSVHADVYEDLKGDDSSALEALTFPKDFPIVTVCALGRVSSKAAKILNEKGLQVYSLTGGMKAWSLAWNVAEVVMPLPGVKLYQLRRVGKGCLSYLLAVEHEAAVFDPSLQPDVYMELAKRNGLRIKAVLDTHVHADHISRSQALASLACADRYLPAEAAAGSGARPLSDGEVLGIGSVNITALHTPGHTPESTSYSLGEKALITGDTLFLESVGRPDLMDGFDSMEQAKRLYGGLQRLLEFPDSTLILPGHHPVPPVFDGVPVAASLGEVRKRNKYLRASEPEFLALIFAGGNTPPPNHLPIIAANQTGILPEGDWTSLEAGPNRCAGA